MPDASKRGLFTQARRCLWAALLTASSLSQAQVLAPVNTSGAACSKPVYLTFDTGHMGVAPLIAEVLQRHQVKVTFFAANEPTQAGDGSLGQHWAPWWQARAAEGHAFASHTFDHVYWQADAPEGRFDVRPSAGPHKGQRQRWTSQAYCAEITRARDRLQALTGVPALPLFRAPGGKTSPALLRAARACGYAHVGWANSGFLGDELPSDRYPNERLLRQSLERIRAGDILMAHLGIWSRQDPWAPAVLEPLIQGLQQQGFCFRTLREHPLYRPWIAQHGA
jgi:peptidoglycan/xylan/chitin deacetylase (PgdA/CDA1 family)